VYHSGGPKSKAAARGEFRVTGDEGNSNEGRGTQEGADKPEDMKSAALATMNRTDVIIEAARNFLKSLSELPAILAQQTQMMLWGFMSCDIYVIIAMNTEKVII
jgi:hypothetical protein